MNTITQKGQTMIKTTLEFIKPFIKEYPAVALLIVGAVLNVWGYLNLQAADSLKADRDSVEELKVIMVEIRTEQKLMARYYTGKETFAERPTLPPSEYLIGVPEAALRQKYDSCFEERIPDSNGIRPWICYYHRPGKPDTFRIFGGQ